jgi:hypothetical protein
MNVFICNQLEIIIVFGSSDVDDIIRLSFEDQEGSIIYNNLFLQTFIGIL